MSGEKVTVLNGGVVHDGCNYLAVVLGERDDHWFCNKCGRAGVIDRTGGGTDG